MKDYQRELRGLVRERGITQLLHFTRIENAQSILENGIAGRQYLDDAGVDYLPTDGWGGNDPRTAFSTTIHDLYWSMLDRKQKDMGGEWAVFALDASVIWTHRCRFCWRNASSKEVKDHKAFLGGPWGFERMFEDRAVSVIDDSSYRDARKLTKQDPTDESAEVQILEPVDRELIVALAVGSDWRKTKLEAVMQEMQFNRPVDVWKEAQLA